MVLEEIKRDVQGVAPVQEESHSLPLPAACPGAGAEDEGVWLSWRFGEKLLMLGLPGAEEVG